MGAPFPGPEWNAPFVINPRAVRYINQLFLHLFGKTVKGGLQKKVAPVPSPRHTRCSSPTGKGCAIIASFGPALSRPPGIGRPSGVSLKFGHAAELNISNARDGGCLKGSNLRAVFLGRPGPIAREHRRPLLYKRAGCSRSVRRNLKRAFQQRDRCVYLCTDAPREDRS